MTLTEEQRQELAYIESMLYNFEEHLQQMKRSIRIIFNYEAEGILDDMTPEQKKDFMAAVKRGKGAER